MPEALLGFLTALAADGPEIASATVALLKGATGVSLGVVVGSDVFNLAAMLGLTVLIAGRIWLHQEAVALEGGVAVLVTLIVAGVVFDIVPAAVAVVLIGCLVLPYLLLLARGSQIARRLPFSAGIDRGLARALSERERRGHHGTVEEAAVWRLVAVMLPAVALIVLGSAGMVETAISLANHWDVPDTVVGVLVLAPLTSIPNAFTAARFGLARRGSTLVSETLNSNTINLVAGVAVRLSSSASLDDNRSEVRIRLADADDGRRSADVDTPTRGGASWRCRPDRPLRRVLRRRGDAELEAPLVIAVRGRSWGLSRRDKGWSRVPTL